MFLHLLTDPAAWLSLATLALLEVVLGIDNVIFLSIIASRLPPEQRPAARRIGLALALVFRVILLGSLSWIIGLTAPILTIGDFALSWRDLVLAGGGVFLIYKSTSEIHSMLEGEHGDGNEGKAHISFGAAVAQIAVLDVVFSLDSVITAVGMVEHLPVMIAAVVIAIGIMLLAADPVGKFVESHPTVKMLALSFLLAIGMTLIADGAHIHVPRGYIYGAIAFSIVVETLNLMAAARRKKNAGSKG